MVSRPNNESKIKTLMSKYCRRALFIQISTALMFACMTVFHHHVCKTELVIQTIKKIGYIKISPSVFRPHPKHMEFLPFKTFFLQANEVIIKKTDAGVLFAAS